MSTPAGAHDVPAALRPDAAKQAAAEDGIEQLGSRIRAARLARGIGVRELSRLVDCSASLISQIERGRANPSVSTLYAISSALEISVDSLFAAAGATERREASGEAASETRGDPDERPELSPGAEAQAVAGISAALAGLRRAAPGAGASQTPAEAHSAELAIRSRGLERLDQRRRPVAIHASERRVIHLERGVRWELLMPTPEHDAEFMEVHYAPGGGSAGDDHAIRHQGREYSVILEGVLSAQIGFEQYQLGPGDSMAFDSTIPHRFWNEGIEPVRAIWFVLDRRSTVDG